MDLRVHRVNQPVLLHVHPRLHIVVARTGLVSVRASWVSRPSQSMTKDKLQRGKKQTKTIHFEQIRAQSLAIVTNTHAPVPRPH